MTLDLHGLSHYDAINLVEDTLLLQSTKGNVNLTVITGKSSILQNKIINEICNRWGFIYSIPSDNQGQIDIQFIKL